MLFYFQLFKILFYETELLEMRNSSVCIDGINGNNELRRYGKYHYGQFNHKSSSCSHSQPLAARACHWKKEGWSLAETSRITFIAGLSHVISTVIIGILLGLIGGELANHLDHFTHVIAPSILILLGLYFIRQHYEHRHFQVKNEKLARKTKRSIITALVIAMFLSPCMEIEAYFLLAGTRGWHMMALIALMYSVITITGMLIWVRIVYKGLLKLNWHKWEHNAGIITGLTLVFTGIISFFIH